ncbi:tyrosine-protein kinase RYK-like isoform X2 [Corticium candelabrum]|uniref:tyrosine-protein kinase RYK-like isoform X2 n=1 Tax=Corticium candelabrum TaxID=121492 RepID=UPI002E275793|nr:tyrosine-protein kinase RYK-like isoform X2 [Corticium candelabrum]
METALLVVAVFGLSSATLDFYLDMEESKLLGLDRPLYYIKKGLINKVAFNPAYQIAMPVDKTNIRFSWRSKSQWIYTIRFRSSDESIMHRPTSKTLDPLGLVPRNVSVFDVTLDCTGQKGGLAFFELSLNVTDPSSVLVLAIDRPKRCRQESLPHVLGNCLCVL